MAFDVSTVTYKGAELLASATSGNKLVLAGCDAFTNSYTDVQAAAVTTRVSSPMTTSTDVTLIGSAQNHVMARSVFEGGVTTGGSARTLMLFGHTENDPSNDYVIAVVSSNSDFHLPDASDAITTFETLFDISYNVPDSSVITTSTALFATLAEFNDLKDRVVITHNQGDSTNGPDQDIYGYKSFYDMVAFHDEVNTYTKDEDEDESGHLQTWLSCYKPTGQDHPVYEYYIRLEGDGTGCVFIEMASRDAQSNGINDDGSGLLTFHCKKCKFDSQSVNVDAQLNVERIIKFGNFPNNTYAGLVAVPDNVNLGGLIRISNVDYYGYSVNDVIAGNDGVNPPYFEVSTSDIRFVKHPNSTVADSDLKFSIGPFNTETFGDIKMYNRDADARRLHGRQCVNNSFSGRYIRYFMTLEDDNNDSVCSISLQHLDTWDEGHVFISGKTLHLDVDYIYTDSNRTVKVGASDSRLDEVYVNHIYTHQLDVDEAMSVDELDVDSFLRLQTVYAKQGDVLTVNVSDTDCGLEITEPPNCIGAHIVYVQKNGVGSTARLDVKANDIYIGCQSGSLSGGFMVNSLDTTFQDSPVTFDNGSAVTFDADVTINGFVDSNITPKTSNSKDLGSSSKKWATIYGVGVECETVTCTTVYGDLSGCIPFSGDGTTSVLLKAGTIGLFFISTSVLGGDTVWNPGKHVSFSNAGNNKIFFAVNRNFTVSSVNLAGFQRDTQTTISANTVHLVLLSSLYGDTSNSNSFNLALCMITADQG